MPTVPLDADQRTAVNHDGGACRVLAGPGSGKTRVIVERFLALVERGVDPDGILVLTYTNKAAAEMRQRVEEAHGVFNGEAPLTTYHAFAGRLLRRYGWQIGISPTFRILDDAEGWLHLDAVLSDMRPHTVWNALRPHDMIRPLLKLFQSAKQELVAPPAYARWAEQRVPGDDDIDAALLERHAQCAQVYAALQARYRRHGVLDHDDTIFHAYELLTSRDDTREQVTRALQHIMVDEYQDTNYAQARIVEVLAARHGNLFVVADDDQSIYKFRGASQANIERFSTTYPGHASVVLGTNYRSTPEIVAASQRIIEAANPATRVAKTITAQRPGGAAVEIWEAPDERSEADAVAAECAALIANGTAPGEIAWLFRNHADMRAALQALDGHAVPYQVRGGRGFFQLPEIKDMLALLGATADVRDSQALLRCLLMPVWKVSNRGRVALVNACADNDVALIDLLQRDCTTILDSPDDVGAATRCADAITTLAASAARDDVRDLFFDALDTCGYMGLLDDADVVRRRQMGANLNKFGELLEGFADWSDDRRVATALRYLMLLRDSGAADEIATADIAVDGVELLTAHSAKGLEWPVVFLARCAQSRWPGRPQAGDRLTLPADLVDEPAPDGDGHIDEERRLFYVAATRARDRLVFTYARRYATTFSREGDDISTFLAGHRAAGVAVTRDVPASGPPRPRRRRAPAAEREQPRISVSDIDAFRSCPRRFEFRRVYRLPVRRGVAAWYGTLMHAVLQEAGARRGSGDDVGIDEVVRLWHSAWESTPGPRGLNASLRPLGEEQLRRYCVTAAWRDGAFSQVELPFAVATNAASVVGRFDRIDERPGGVTVVDYKTGEPKTPERLAADTQVRAYAAAAGQIANTDDVAVEMHYLQTAEVVRVGFDRPTLERAFRNISAVTGEILGAWNGGGFVAKPSAWNCSRCDYRTVCDEAAPDGP